MARAWSLALLLVGALFAGCIGAEDLEQQSAPDVQKTLDWARSIPETITGLDHLVQLTDEDGNAFGGAGIWAEGDYVYLPGYTKDGLRIVDVSDPENPVVVGEVAPEDLDTPRDVDLLHYENRTVAVVATNFRGMTFIDVTDPTSPEIISKISLARIHNLGVVPGTHIVYDSTGRKHIQNEIIDASDPENPRIIGSFGEFACHDISFWVSEDGEKRRGYCAANQVSSIWDLEDPRAPALVARVHNVCMDHGLPNQLPTPPQNPEFEDGLCGGFHHSAYVNEDASILIIGDEYEGATRPGCFAHAETPAGTASSPIGALWFYDITDEKNPEMLGWFSPPLPAEATAEVLADELAKEREPDANDPFKPVDDALSAPRCTSHFGDIVPGNEMTVVGWYRAGVLLVDFSDPANPQLVDQWNQGTDTWDARVLGGYVFTGDIGRGMDVLTFLGQ